MYMHGVNFRSVLKTQIKELTERVEEFWCLSPPKCLVILGDDVIGLVFVNLRVVGHLIQNVIHLSHGGKTNYNNHIVKLFRS